MSRFRVRIMFFDRSNHFTGIYVLVASKGMNKALSIVAFIPNESEEEEYMNANKELIALLYSHI